MTTDRMYEVIASTIQALDCTCIDGSSTVEIDPYLQAYSAKRLIPDTELSMLQSNALPMSEADIKEFKEMIKRKNSMEYRVKQYAKSSKTLTEITGSRIRIAYRLARYMTHVRGISNIGQPLIPCMASGTNTINKLDLPLPYDPTIGWSRGLAAVRNLLAECTESDKRYTYNFGDTLFVTAGMSILPPPLHDGYFPTDKQPWEYRRLNYSPPTYTPISDGPLNTYLNMMELLVRHLGMDQTEDIDEQAAITALLNPTIARLAWPCKDEIETYEEYILLPYLNNHLIDLNRVQAIEAVKKELKLTHGEAYDYVEMARVYSQVAFDYTPEKERSTMINKLHKLAGECDKAGMVTTQLNSYKTISQILGLTRNEEDSNVDRREVLSTALEADIADKKERKSLQAG